MKTYFELGGGRHGGYLLCPRRAVADTAKRLFDAREPLLVEAFDEVSRVAAADAPAEEGGGTGNPALSRYAADNSAARVVLSAAFLAALHEANGDKAECARLAGVAKSVLLRLAEREAPGYDPGLGFLNHIYLIGSAFAYDLVKELVDWSDAQRDGLRRLFYGKMPELRERMHSRHMSNHAAWPMCRVATTGILFGDEELVREAFDGPDSYANRLAHQFFDDGMSYEQSSWGYHCFSVEPMILTALAGRGAGLKPDPLKARVENDLSLTFLGGPTGDYTMPFYPADTDEFPRPPEKDMRGALTAQFNLLRPDTTCPNMGDYAQPTPPMADHWIPELAWDLYGDKRAARLLSMGRRRAEGTHFLPPYFLTLAFGKPLPGKAAFPAKSVIYPQAGYAVLRAPEGDGFWGSQAAQAVVKFGPFGNGHGHADKLHLDISGAGRKTCTEELDRAANDWRYWNSTVSHNTVVVGARSQPGNEEMFALNDSCGRLLHRRFTSRYSIACVEAGEVYEGLRRYRRTVVLTNRYLVDVFEVASKTAEKTTFDWFLHGRGSLDVDGVALSADDFGKAEEGYEFLKDVRSGWTAYPFEARFGEGHKVFFPCAGDTQVFVATGPWKTGEGRPALVVRKYEREAVFVAVHDPSGRTVESVDYIDGGAGAFVLHVVGAGFAEDIALAPGGKAAWSRTSTAAGPLDVLFFREKRPAR